MKKLLLSLFVSGLLITGMFGKEPTNIMFGIGAGVGMTNLDIQHSFAMKHPINNRDYGKPGWEGTAAWPAQQDRSLNSWSGAWEFLIGYKHFINDWVGMRYYGNLGFQHYKPSLYSSKVDPIGFVDYSLNADVLINFYETTSFSIGILGGLGLGGTSFMKDAVDKYLVVYDRDTGLPVGKSDVKKHHLNINASTGIRATYFQKVRRVSEKVCDENYVDGKRLCRVPYHYIGHSFEINAKFNVLDYKATGIPDIGVVGTQVTSKPAYTVKNPYRITLRYIVDF